MATKPSSLPRWAETAGGTPSAAITEPSSGQKDTGWAVAQKPPAQFFNWLLHLIYKWIEYLNDGDLSGNHTIAGTLGVTGLFTASAGVSATGNVAATAAVTSATVTATGKIEGDDIEANGDIYWNDTAPLHIGAPEFFHGYAGEWTVGGHTANPPQPELAPASTANPTFATLRLASGIRIDRIDYHWLPDGGTITGRLTTYRPADGSTSTISTTTSSSATRTTTTSATINHNLAVADRYLIQIQAPASSTTARVYGVTVHFNKPL